MKRKKNSALSNDSIEKTLNKITMEKDRQYYIDKLKNIGTNEAVVVPILLTDKEMQEVYNSYLKH